MVQVSYGQSGIIQKYKHKYAPLIITLELPPDDIDENRKWKKVLLDVSSEGAMEEEKAGAGDAPPPVGASTDAAGAAPILTSKNAAKKAAKARAKAEAKAKARVEKGLDPNPPKNPRQRLVPLLETTRRAALAGTKRDNPEPIHDPDDASPSTSIKKLPKSAVFKRTNKDNEVIAEVSLHFNSRTYRQLD